VKCIAFTESRVTAHAKGAGESVVYTPCPLKAHTKGARFCVVHAKAYREIVLAIVLNLRKS